MRRYLWPRLELTNLNTSLDWASSVGAIQWHNLVDDQLSPECYLQSQSRHVLNESVDAHLGLCNRCALTD